MNAYDYLSRVRSANIRFEAKQEELCRLESMVNSVTQDISPRESCRVPMSRDRRGDSLVSYMMAKEALVAAMEETIFLRSEAMEYLDKLENPNHYQVLYKRYMVGLEWEEIAEDLHYTYRHVHKLHSDALVKFQEILDAE